MGNRGKASNVKHGIRRLRRICDTAGAAQYEGTVNRIAFTALWSSRSPCTCSAPRTWSSAAESTRT